MQANHGKHPQVRVQILSGVAESSGFTTNFSRSLFTRSFEDVVERLQRLKGLYVEGDGSFFWTEAEADWQVWGMLYDCMVHDSTGGDVIRMQGSVSRLQYCELQGSFPRHAWKDLLACLSTPEEELLILQLPEMQLRTCQEFETIWPELSEGKA